MNMVAKHKTKHSRRGSENNSYEESNNCNNGISRYRGINYGASNYYSNGVKYELIDITSDNSNDSYDYLPRDRYYCLHFVVTILNIYWFKFNNLNIGYSAMTVWIISDIKSFRLTARFNIFSFLY